MDTGEFWNVVEEARRQTGDPSDSEAVAERAVALLAERPAGEIVAAQQVLWDLLAMSYRNPLWAAAYVINGGCSDDGFDYFRGWLLLQGQQVYERVVAEPDALAELAVVRDAAEEGFEMECESALGLAWDAYLRATGEELPQDSFTIRYPDLEPAWDFDDTGETERRLPRLSALYAE
ncbi:MULTISPECIES: DUF4240 domain-containing protein [Streptomyces]|uniref:DUF4240 domain-containing protein n=1 Tax=Streptomyces dengpaensis TaxID=2049881 RepID=A0ABN5I6K8_9ACTN|nr:MULTISPECIES: DUF4240 domain-containing protein [Streptomyces]AVH58733.1 DUF4240 domain-containing protein [Streptomyces dengpaensis]PIB11205.1 hypothetical protein B1C81_05090 [Streptomyces sp. HG99]